MAETGSSPQEPREVGMLVTRSSDLATVASRLKEALEQKTEILFIGRNSKEEEAAGGTDTPSIGEFEQIHNSLSFCKDMMIKAIEFINRL